MPRKKGTPNLTKEQKAKIVAEKNSGVFTVPKIAELNGVADRTVQKVMENVTPEVVALAETFKQQTIKKAERNVLDGMDVMHERIYDPKSRLSEITGAVKISHDIARLEKDESTSNVAVSTPSDTAKQYFDYLLRQGIDRQDAIMKLRGATALEVDGEVLNDVADELEKG